MQRCFRSASFQISLIFVNQIDLKNRVAIVTGGAQGFGYAMVERFAKSAANVVIWDMDKELVLFGSSKTLRNESIGKEIDVKIEEGKAAIAVRT